ncbi:MAG: hypothetical protein LBQ91_03070 [Oscillospiraceae bacterium]|jgi:hypothetical protein|nr:hypothetical protein [Oscillospiraceae bacterium]
MKKKTKKILTVVLLIWFFMFAADIVLAFVIKWPIFCIPMSGGELSMHLGLGYIISFDVPITAIEEYVPALPHIFPWVYIAVNAAIIAAMVRSARRKKGDE